MRSNVSATIQMTVVILLTILEIPATITCVFVVGGVTIVVIIAIAFACYEKINSGNPHLKISVNVCN